MGTPAQQWRARQLGSMTQANTVARNNSQTTSEDQAAAPNAADAVKALQQQQAQSAAQVANRQMAKTSQANKAFFGE